MASPIPRPLLGIRGGIMLRGMIIPDDRPTARQRQLEDMGQATSNVRVLKGGRTALMHGLNESQKVWLGQFVTNRWNLMHGLLSSWRGKLRRFERMSEDDYAHRISSIDPSRTDATQSIFSKNNDSLGMVNGWAEFTNAQAANDIFGTKPWMAATPVGKDDRDLSDSVTKHSQWKFDQSDMEVGLKDAIKLAIDLGTSFVKMKWLKDIDKSESVAWVAHQNGKALTTENGDYLMDDASLEAWIAAGSELSVAAGGNPIDGAGIEWREMLIENITTIYSNVQVAPLDYNDVAFDPMAPALDLLHTDFMHRFPIGLMDAVSTYNLTEDQARDLRNAVLNDHSNPRAERGESSALAADWTALEEGANPTIYLVEGFFRCNPFGAGHNDPKRIRVVFSPDLNLTLEADYLANVTPGAIVPVFPVRCFKIPKRLIARGYFEVCEKLNDNIDGCYNASVYADRMARWPISGGDDDALELDEGYAEEDLAMEPGKRFKVKPNRRLDEAFQFVQLPDTTGKTKELMDQALQAGQTRLGITSASQGDLAGLPESNTATGVNQIVSRGAVLVKWPIDQIKRDLEKCVDYGVQLNYANLDMEEVFTWGEGREAQIVKIKPGDVAGLRLNVTLTLTQSQSQEKYQAAQGAIAAAAQYAALPEIEKQSQRPLFVQVIKTLGWDDAEEIIRSPIVSPVEIMALLPPESQGMFANFLAEMGIPLPVEAGGGVSGAPGASSPSGPTSPPVPAAEPVA